MANTTTDTVAVATPEVPAPAAPAAKAPARKRAPRKTAAPQGPAETVDMPEAPAAVEPVPAKKPRRSPARKAAAAAPQEPPVTQSTAEPTLEAVIGVVAEVAPAVVAEPVAELAVAPTVEPAPEPAPPPPDLTPLHSSVTLVPGLRHTLQWTAGRHCPADLAAAAQALGTPTDAAPLVNDLALAELVRLARERRHPLQVEPAVWDWLAGARDMRARVEHLERQHPLGPLSPGLATLLSAPLRPYQAEAALFAACAGRSVLADDAGLGKTVQAIATLRLLQQSFGAERALVLCPPERLAHWQAQWQRWAATPEAPDTPATPAFEVVFADLTRLTTDLATLQGLGADVVVVDEPALGDASPWQQPGPQAALRTLDSPWALVLARQPLETRQQVLEAVLDWVDPGHYGAVAALQGGHLDALAPWWLQRSRTLVLRQLPETVEHTAHVALTPEDRAQHDAWLAQLRHGVQRWQRSQFLGSREQRQWLHMLQALRQCGQDHKADAALQTIDAALQPAEAKVVVFSQWPEALDRLAAALQARGTVFCQLTSDVVGDARRALVGEFQQTPTLRVLLCADDERGGQLGLRHAATAIVHLDRPWNAALLGQRLSRVHRADRVRLVEVHHVVVADSIESRLVAAQQADTGRERFVGLVEGPSADAFLDGPRLMRFLDALATLVLH
jgi:SNF2-related domain